MTDDTVTDDTMAAIALQHEVTAFLNEEAELLDEGRLREWLDLLTDDVVYQVPIRITKEHGNGEGSRVTGVMEDSFHLDEDRDSLEMRVDRIETGFAWAEEPPTRLRHVIGNVRVKTTHDPDRVEVRSNLLLYHARWDRPDYNVLSGERRDVLVREDGDWKLSQRLVVLDNTVIPTLNLSFFL